MNELISDIESALEGENSREFLTELAGAIERFLEEQQAARLTANPEVYELPSLLLQLGAVVDTSVTDEL